MSENINSIGQATGLAENASQTEKQLTDMEKFAEKMSRIFATIASDGKISAGEIAKSFLAMSKEILDAEFFSSLGGIGDLLGGSVGKIFSGVIGGLAGGGTIQPNKPTLVGERGPELFIPNISGRIANNHDTGNMLGGNEVTINQTINIEPSTQKDLVAMIHASRPMMKEDAKRAVMDALEGIRY